MKIEWKSVTKLELINYFNDGLWYEDIAEIFEVSGRAVRDKATKFGITLERKNKKKEVELQVCKVCGKTYKQSINEGFCSGNCKTLFENINRGITQTTQSNLGKRILELRSQGLSQKSIAVKLGCARSTVGYHCSPITKKTSKERKARYFEEDPTKYKFIKHLDNFKSREQGNGRKISKNWNKKIITAVSRFRLRTSPNKNNKQEVVEQNYSYLEAIEHLGGLKTKCYLTGKDINLETDEYCLDHIIPVAKGGSNELDNMGITIPKANASKSDLQLEEYLDLCKMVLEHHGYTVNK